MDDENHNQNIRTLLNLAEQHRLRWSTLIYAILGFIIAANIGVIGYFITAYIHEPAHPAFLLIGSAISSILTGAWRLYSHYVDNNIANLYPEIFYYESTIGIPNQFGITRYLNDNVKNISVLFSSSITNEQKCAVLRMLSLSKNIGRRGHLGFDIACILWTSSLLIACPISLLLVNRPIGLDYMLFFLCCTIITAFGLGLAIWALCISQKNPSSKIIKEAIQVHADQ